MCRLLVFLTKPNDERTLIRELIDEFIKASVKDVYIHGKSHGDGWGFACIAYASRAKIPVIMSYKTVHPIDSSSSSVVIEKFLERIRRYDEAYILMHSRLAGLTEPYGDEHAHPYFFQGRKHLLWFVHNGGIDKFKLSGSIGAHPLLHTDSWFASAYINSKLEECSDDIDTCVASIYRGLAELVFRNSSLNTGLMVLLNDKPYIYASYIPGDEAKNSVFYAMYQYVDEANIAVFSSTIHYYMVQDSKEHADKVKQLRPGVYKLSFEDKIINLW